MISKRSTNLNVTPTQDDVVREEIEGGHTLTKPRASPMTTSTNSDAQTSEGPSRYKELKSTLIPPALIKTVMVSTYKFKGQEREQLIIILKNLICCEQPELCATTILPKNLYEEDLAAKKQHVKESSLDAFSRISGHFYRWIYQIMLMPDNELKVLGVSFGSQLYFLSFRTRKTLFMGREKPSPNFIASLQKGHFRNGHLVAVLLGRLFPLGHDENAFPILMVPFLDISLPNAVQLRQVGRLGAASHVANFGAQISSVNVHPGTKSSAFGRFS